MYIKVQISDEVYKALVASGKRKRGSIALVGPKEGNFNAFSSGKVRTKPPQVCQAASWGGQCR